MVVFAIASKTETGAPVVPTLRFASCSSIHRQAAERFISVATDRKWGSHSGKDSNTFCDGRVTRHPPVGGVLLMKTRPTENPAFELDADDRPLSEPECARVTGL